jgi:hypothetical protein
MVGAAVDASLPAGNFCRDSFGGSPPDQAIQIGFM